MSCPRRPLFIFDDATDVLPDFPPLVLTPRRLPCLVRVPPELLNRDGTLPPMTNLLDEDHEEQ